MVTATSRVLASAGSAITSAYERALHIPPGSNSTVRSASAGPDLTMSQSVLTEPTVGAVVGVGHSATAPSRTVLLGTNAMFTTRGEGAPRGVLRRGSPVGGCAVRVSAMASSPSQNGSPRKPAD